MATAPHMDSSPAQHAPAATFSVRAQAPTAIIELAGTWRAEHTLPRADDIISTVASQQYSRWTFTAAADFAWDSACMTRLFHCARHCEQHGIDFNIDALPAGMQKLLTVATAVKPQAAHPSPRPALLQQLQSIARGLQTHAVDFLGFVGTVMLALLNLLRGRANTRTRDFFYFVEQCGPQALGIVALIAVLVGMILAYLGSVQLRQFGAEVYVANLVTLGMVREMGALMTAVIMAGRTGAAYAAQLGTMQTNEEIDAITTLGISPVEYLVLPRMLALVAVMPLLCIFADVLGVVGGALVAIGMDVSPTQFFSQARIAVGFNDIVSGIIKSVAFALLIATAGCQAGLQSGRSSAAVGLATTRAVVNAIVYLVVADAALNILYDKIHF
jgi:phospholipid/cholesterol/gamma-HCH transport system permease protein